MKTNIIYLPLDERPCNYKFAKNIWKSGQNDYQLIMPGILNLGRKKQPADYGKIKEFLLKSALISDIAVVSIDMLLYGGIVPSRIHCLSLTELQERLLVLKQMKELNPAIKIYAYNLIMRCPQQSSSEEEPDYYADCGREIFLLGEALQKQELGLLSNEEALCIDCYKEKTKGVLSNYLSRREINTQMNYHVIDEIEKSIDFLIIPQDDSSVYGYIAKDQQKIRNYLKQKKQQLKALIYPGADEVGMTLLSRALNEHKKNIPTVALNYSSASAPFCVPLYEDRCVCETLKYHITAAGCVLTEDILNADIVLMVNAAPIMIESLDQGHAGREYTVERCLPEFLAKAEYLLNRKKLVAIADIAFANGSDIELVELLDKSGIAMRLAGYAAWNTSSNTIGTALSQAVAALHFGMGKDHGNFLASRYFEDAAFCSHAAEYVRKNYLDAHRMPFRKTDGINGVDAQRVARHMTEFMQTSMPHTSNRYKLVKCEMPWSRMFETDIEVE